MEPLAHPVWRKRVRCLATVMVTPATLRDIQREARRAWGWPGELTQHTVAAGEGRELRALRRDGVWLYGRVPGRYRAVTTDAGRALRDVVAETVRPSKRVPKRRVA